MGEDGLTYITLLRGTQLVLPFAMESVPYAKISSSASIRTS